MACKLSCRIVNQITKSEGSPTATPVKESRAEMAQNDKLRPTQQSTLMSLDTPRFVYGERQALDTHHGVERMKATIYSLH